jgi:glycosyltransferase involved in cell wall biosynthesis
MRVGIDVSIVGGRTRASGIGRYVTRLIEHLPALDADSVFVLFAPADVEPLRDLPPNVEWQPLPRLRLGKLATPAAYFWALPRLARARRLDVFHAPTVHPRPSWPPVPRRLPCPLVVTIHDLIPLTFYASGPSRLPRTHLAFYRWNLRAATRAAGVITVSDAERNTIASVLRMPRDCITSIYNGVDVPAPGSRPSSPHKAPYVLFVGSYEPRKNLAALVRAHGLARQRGLAHDLVAVATSGSGPTEPVEAAVRSHGLSDRSQFVDGRRLADADLAALYTHADMFVYPSVAESFGLPPLEAMAAGGPVIASDLPALREVLGDAAIFVDGRDEAQIAEAMLRLDRDPEERRRRGAAGAVWARRYSWESCARQTLDVYRRAAGGTRNRMALDDSLGVMRAI